jgi:hypothetical protein
MNYVPAATALDMPTPTVPRQPQTYAGSARSWHVINSIDSTSACASRICCYVLGQPKEKACHLYGVESL